MSKSPVVKSDAYIQDKADGASRAPSTGFLAPMQQMETTLLKGFWKSGSHFEMQLKANEAIVSGFNKRLISVEERLSELERKSHLYG